MSEWIGKKGTTGPSVCVSSEGVIRVYASEGSVLVYSVYDAPEHVLVSHIDDLFNWVFENYSSEIDECMEALGI